LYEGKEEGNSVEDNFPRRNEANGKGGMLDKRGLWNKMLEQSKKQFAFTAESKKLAEYDWGRERREEPN